MPHKAQVQAPSLPTCDSNIHHQMNPGLHPSRYARQHILIAPAWPARMNPRFPASFGRCYDAFGIHPLPGNRENE